MHNKLFSGPDINRSLCLYQPVIKALSLWGTSPVGPVFPNFFFFFSYRAYICETSSGFEVSCHLPPLFSSFFPLYFCFKWERSNSQKCGNFDYLIFRDFQLPMLLKFFIEETLLPYILVGFRHTFMSWEGC